MAARHWPLFVDIVGLNPPSDMRFGLVKHAAVKKTALFAENAQTSARQWCRVAFSSRVWSTRRRTPQFFDICRGLGYDLTILASLWATGVVVPRSGVIGV